MDLQMCQQNIDISIWLIDFHTQCHLCRSSSDLKKRHHFRVRHNIVYLYAIVHTNTPKRWQQQQRHQKAKFNCHSEWMSAHRLQKYLMHSQQRLLLINCWLTRMPSINLANKFHILWVSFFRSHNVCTISSRLITFRENNNKNKTTKSR